MYSEELRKLAIKLRNEGKTYACIGEILGLTKEVTRQLCRYILCKQCGKRGPKFKITNAHKSKKDTCQN